MCGIAGLVFEQLDPRGSGWITAMTQRLFHRGPDDGGAVVFGLNGSPVQERRLGAVHETVEWGYLPCHVALGVRRLAIQDLSPAGHQPMSSPGGHVWIAFNGEIYNHAALRDELRSRGAAFVGLSDTEVLLHAYRAWGMDCFARLEGMWGLAIVDWTARRLVLSRDRLGIKPLYLSKFDDGLAFASEIKPLLSLPGVVRNVNEAALRDFLVGGRVDREDATFFDGVYAAPPGCAIEWPLRRAAPGEPAGRAIRYWQPVPGWGSDESADGESVAASSIRESLAAAVRSHLTGDVPVGSCLSGGIDSSAVVMLASRAADDGIVGSHWSQYTFTATLPGSPLDEARYAAMVLEAAPKLKGNSTSPTGRGLAENLDRLLEHQEQPFGSPSIYMQWEVMRLARETGVKVLLDGQGGDELFCGYEGHWPPMLAHLLMHGRMIGLVKQFRQVPAWAFSRGSLAGRTLAHALPADWRESASMRRQFRRQAWLDRDLADAESPPDIWTALRIVPPAPLAVMEEGPALARQMWNILVRESLPGLLRFEDRNSMAFSIEARVPMLDRALVEAAMRTPPGLNLRDGQTKRVLRFAMRGIVPDAILARTDKIGFAAPTLEWMSGPLRAWWGDLIGSKSFRERGCFDVKGVESLTNRIDANSTGAEHERAGAALDLWRVALTEAWARQFLDQR